MVWIYLSQLCTALRLYKCPASIIPIFNYDCIPVIKYSLVNVLEWCEFIYLFRCVRCYSFCVCNFALWCLVFGINSNLVLQYAVHIIANAYVAMSILCLIQFISVPILLCIQVSSCCHGRVCVEESMVKQDICLVLLPHNSRQSKLKWTRVSIAAVTM